jgi:3-hydroxymyristoyl/3-hydroxydecanoyl-(acyl carrier protein) dehydratase
MKFTAELPVPPDHPAYAGHFPSFPLLPGAALLDEVLHFICQAQRLEASQCRIAAAKFLDMVRPGDRPNLEYELSGGADIQCRVSVGTRTVLRATLTCRPS